MKLFLLFLSSILLSLSCNRPSSSKINQGIDGIKLNADKQLNVAATMMDEARMAEAQNLLLKTLQNDSIRLTNADLYYINSFLAEIMYYSALFDQGINYSRRAKAIALEMKNDALQGSSDNFLGLFYLNKNFLDSAVINFKNALSLIKENDSTLWISRRYHVFNNLGETYLKLKNPDSVKYFTKKAIELCRKENIPRAYALGMWNLSESSIIEKDYSKAIQFADTGLSILNNQEILSDVKLFLLGSKMKAYALGNEKQMTFKILNESDKLLNDKLVNIYAKTEYLKAAIKSLISTDQLNIASPLQTQLRELEESLKIEEDKSRIKILNNYYQNEQKLLLMREEKEKQSLKLFLTSSLNIALTALFVVSLVLLFFIRKDNKHKTKIQLLAFEAEKEELNKIQEIKAVKANFESLQNERNRIAKELHDDIGSSLSSINIFTSLAIEALPENKEKTEIHLRKIKNLASSIADNLSDLIWAVYSKNDTYGHLILRMKNFCYDILNERNIETEFYFDPKIQDWQADLTIRKNLIQFFKEAINNILKYSNANRIQIHLNEQDGFIKLLISDNGIGFDSASIIEGNGFTSFRARAKAMNGKLKFNSQPGNGAEVSVEIKISTKIED